MMEPSTLTFGIVIPTYNRKKLLSRAINSILGQSYTSWYICIVDDGSSDGTNEMMQTYNHPNIHYIKQASNKGVNAARNTALEHLINIEKCDFITFLDDDDYFHPEALFSALHTIDEHPEMQWFVSKRIDQNAQDITRIDYYGVHSYVKYFLGISMDHDATHVISAQLIGDIRFSREFKQAEEWIFFMKLAGLQEMFVYDFPSTICIYLEEGLSQQKKKNHKKSAQDIAVEKLRIQMLQDLGYTHASVELIKLQYRVNKTLYQKRYHKLFRYFPRYIYYKMIVMTQNFLKADHDVQV